LAILKLFGCIPRTEKMAGNCLKIKLKQTFGLALLRMQETAELIT
jgi:hypothetical protein